MEEVKYVDCDSQQQNIIQIMQENQIPNKQTIKQTNLWISCIIFISCMHIPHNHLKIIYNSLCQFAEETLRFLVFLLFFILSFCFGLQFECFLLLFDLFICFKFFSLEYLFLFGFFFIIPL